MHIQTVPNTLDELEVQVADIARNLNQVPFDRIGANLNGALENANRLFGHMDTEVVPQARDTLAAAMNSAHLDIMVNNAGIAQVQALLDSLTELIL
jgi:paraquat-inducible protein B